MKYLIHCSLLIIPVLFLSTQYGPFAQETKKGAYANNNLSGTVLAVLDGDSIRFQTGQRVIDINLAGIDAPELDQTFGMHSSKYLSDLVNRREVTIEMREPDEQGIAQGELFLDGVSINKLLLKDGFAWAVRGKSGDRTLVSLEQLAHKQGFGLWRYENALAPWEYRAQVLEGSFPGT